jgi:hypothetical protein
MCRHARLRQPLLRNVEAHKCIRRQDGGARQVSGRLTDLGGTGFRLTLPFGAQRRPLARRFFGMYESRGPSAGVGSTANSAVAGDCPIMGLGSFGTLAFLRAGKALDVWSRTFQGFTSRLRTITKFIGRKGVVGVNRRPAGAAPIPAENA